MHKRGETILEKIFQRIDLNKVSDLHLISGMKPVVRSEGRLKKIEEFPVVTEEEIKKISEIQMLEREEKDFVKTVLGRRVRGNLYYERDEIALALRVLKDKIPGKEELTLTKEVYEILERESGLILVTGATGSGKSTTLAALIEYLNEKTDKRIVTLEDPVEYLFQSKKCVITQREIGRDTRSFQSGIRSALRQDPDVIMVGELRDRESLEEALLASETGHLVLATLHSRNSREALNRVISFFSKEKQDLIKTTLSETLKAVLSQELIETIKGERKALFEILIVNRGVKNLIHRGEINQIYSIIEIGGRFGMRTREESLKNLLDNEEISLKKYREYLPREEI